MPLVMDLATHQDENETRGVLGSLHGERSPLLGLGHRKGSIQEGYDADLIVWEADDYRDPIYWVGGPQRTVFSSIQKN